MSSPTSSTQTHWETVYDSKAPDAVSWYAPHLRESLAFIARSGLPTSAALIDVGGGESTLVDDLLDAGHTHLSVLDLSARAAEVCRARLGERAAQVDWRVGDVLSHPFEAASFDLWHDRAVFHFLTEPAQRRQYVAQVRHALRPGGFVVVATFGPQGPTQCSGLPVARYTAEALHAEFGAGFGLLHHSLDLHTTPWGAPQQFVYCLLQREG